MDSEERGSAIEEQTMVQHHSLFSEFDIYLFKEGRHYKLYEKMGSHVIEKDGQKGVYFAVWAPNAREVSVIGNFNGWDKSSHVLNVRHDGSGIWEGFIPEIGNGEVYKYFVQSNHHGYSAEKGDPYAFMWETPPKTASIVWDLNFKWKDSKWLEQRKKSSQVKAMSVYEMHIGSWRRNSNEDRHCTYSELAEELPAYLKFMGFTHVEFMPVMEHPFYGSWGYQITGYFAPSSRFGSPQDFMYLIEKLHEEGIGIILDWVPSHFPSDLHGLVYFDGTHLYEHADPRKGYHPDWNSYIFNYGRSEVKSFLISNALFWLDKFHIDGLRIDAVASMLYLDYSRKEGEWIPNEHGGRENLEAIEFMKEFNTNVYKEFPDVHTIAEESTAYPGVSKPVYDGGLGFGQKWMMGWMHDTLDYFSKEPVYRKHHHGQITFSILYAFHENFMLPISHDEVVYGKGSMIRKMPGDDWQKFANLRAFYAYMYGHPGTMLLFMGSEFAQWEEWNHDKSLDWHLAGYDRHEGMKQTVRRLNELYKTEPALHDNNFSGEGFRWVNAGDWENSVLSFMRMGKQESEQIIIVCNFTPVVRENYRVGVPKDGVWQEIFNSDSHEFSGSGVVNGEMQTYPAGADGFEQSVSLKLPPLSVVYLKKKSTIGKVGGKSSN